MNARIFLDTRASKGEAPLKIAIAHNKQTAYIPIGVKILPSQWDNDKRMVKDHPQKKELNVFIRSKLSEVELEMLKLRELGKTNGKSATQIKDMIACSLNPELKAKKENERTFLARYKRFVSLKEKKQTIDSYNWTLTHLQEYDKHLEGKTFEEINYDYLNDFMHHCQNLSINSRSILMRNIRAVFNDAIDAGITECYPFRRLSIKTEKTKKKALTLEQMKMLMRTDSKQENEYRDMFLLMFYFRGINAIDLFSARKTQVVNGRLEYRRSKVGSLFSIKIEPEAWAIIKKYKGKEYLLNVLERNKDYRVYLHNMNDGLKHVGCKIGKYNVKTDGLFPKLSSNWARHTWATIGINIGIPQDTITRGMGHSPGLAVTDVYIDYDMRAVDDATRKIIDSLI